jgi:hypothetical protein
MGVQFFGEGALVAKYIRLKETLHNHGLLQNKKKVAGITVLSLLSAGYLYKKFRK